MLGRSSGAIYLAEDTFSNDKSFGVSIRCAALHSTQPRNTSKHVTIEPVLRALASEMRMYKFDLPFDDLCLKRHIEVCAAKVPIPLRDLVLKNQVIAEGICRQ